MGHEGRRRSRDDELVFEEDLEPVRPDRDLGGLLFLLRRSIRVRVGIGRPPPRWDSADYVLSRFSKEDRTMIDTAVKEAADAVETIIRDGIRRAMNVYNRTAGSNGD